MTIIWPSPTMAMIAAKGRLPARPPIDTADGAKIAQTTSKASVDSTTVVNPRAKRRERQSKP